MNSLYRSAIVALLALVSAAPLAACNSEANGPTHFSLKVVMQPDGQAPSSLCDQVGSSAGGSSGVISPDSNIQTSSHNEDGATWYEVRIVGVDGAAHSWRYDEDMTRAGTTLEGHYVDGTTKVVVRISGSFDHIDPCAP